MNRARRVWRILSMRCDESVELLSESQDERLEWVDRLALRSHLLLCKPCRRMARQLQFLRTAMQCAVRRTESSGQRLSAEARARIEQTLRHSPEQ